MMPASAPLADLVTSWRQRAACYRADGLDAPATIYGRVADEVERALAEAADEVLTLAEASAASGYAVDHLRHLVAAGQLPNAGRKGASRVRRGDLPRKPGAGAGQGSAASSSGYDLDADVAHLAGKIAGGRRAS